MELRHLRYFVGVAEEENVSRAAQKLHVSQPALSRQVRDLEEEIGFELLERSAKSVKLTGAGRVFLHEAKAVLERVEDAVKAAAVAAKACREDLHVGYAPTLTVRVLPTTLREFEKVMPGVRVKLHDLSSEEILQGLRKGELHLAFSVKPASKVPGILFTEITREHIRVAVGPIHRFAKRKTISSLDAAKEPLVAYSKTEYPDYHQLIEKVFAGTKPPRISEEHDGVLSLISAVEAGKGITISAESISCMAGARLKLLPLTPEPPPLLIGILSVKSSKNSAAEKFIECAKNSTQAP